MLAIVAAMILPRGFARDGEERGHRSIPFGSLRAARRSSIAIRALMPLSPPDNEANPWKLIAAVPPQLRSQPVLNGYSMGGPLILSGIRPYIDGRGDMYGDDLVLGFARIAHGDANAFAGAVRRWDIRWAIVPNGSKPLIAMLNRTPGWRRIGGDTVGAIYMREKPIA